MGKAASCGLYCTGEGGMCVFLCTISDHHKLHAAFHCFYVSIMLVNLLSLIKPHLFPDGDYSLVFNQPVKYAFCYWSF